MSNDKNQSPDDRKMIPDGDRVRCRVIDYALGAAGTNTEQIGLQLQVTDGPYTGRVLTYYGFFTEKTEEETVKAMVAFGWDGNVQNLDSIKTKDAFATIQHEASEKNGKKSVRERVRWINAIGVRMDKQFNAAEEAGFKRKLSGIAARVLGGKVASGAALPPLPARGADAGPPPPSDDDAPPPFRRG